MPMVKNYTVKNYTSVIWENWNTPGSFNDCASLLLIQICDPFPQRIQRGLCSIGQVQLAQYVAGVFANGAFTEVELFAYSRCVNQ